MIDDEDIPCELENKHKQLKEYIKNADDIDIDIPDSYKVEKCAFENLYKKIGELDFNSSNEQVNISLSIDDVLNITLAIKSKQLEINAKQYIRESIGKNIGANRWKNVAEIMQLKEPGSNRIRSRGYENKELSTYWYYILKDYSANKAAEIIKIKFNFSNQESCNKWIYKEISRHRKLGNKFFGDLPCPSQSPV